MQKLHMILFQRYREAARKQMEFSPNRVNPNEPQTEEEARQYFRELYQTILAAGWMRSTTNGRRGIEKTMLEKKYYKNVRTKANTILSRDDDIHIITKFREMDEKFRDSVMDGDYVWMSLDYYLSREAYRMAAHDRGYTDEVLEERK